jgi:hypothetical protein
LPDLREVVGPLIFDGLVALIGALVADIIYHRIDLSTRNSN